MHLLVIRTSAMGDVALTTPVIRGFLKKYPNNRITVITRASFKPFFNSIDNTDIFCPEFKSRHKGIPGIFRLFNDIRKNYQIDIVIDLHNVLRSRLLRFLFRLSGKPVYYIDKGRKEKRAVISGKILKPLRHTVVRYCDVFGKAGFEFAPLTGTCIIPVAEIAEKMTISNPVTNIIEIGVAPFAKHDLKKWPAENMIKLLGLIRSRIDVKIWLFAGKEEIEQLKSLKLKVPGAEIVAGNLTLDEELALMGRLKFMIAMDSSNMHMASLTGTRVISIWGGTDPKTGFSPWGQPGENAIMIPSEVLSCRPCTVYGKGKCKRGDLACMNWLTPEIVFEKIQKLNLL